MKITTFSNGLEFRMTEADARLASHSGDCTEDIQRLMECEKYLIDQTNAISKESMVAELAEYGAWSDSELENKSHTELAQIIIWLAAGNILEGDCVEEASECVVNKVA